MNRTRTTRTALGIILAMLMSTFFIAPSASAAEMSLVEKRERAINTIFVRTNEYRAEVGMPPLTYNAEIGKVAQAWAQRMSETNNFVHNPHFMSQMPGEPWGAAENIAKAFPGTGDRLSVMWYNSTGHWTNMVGNYNQIGIGIYIDSDGVMWGVQNFGKYSNPQADPVPGVGKPLDGSGETEADELERFKAESIAAGQARLDKYVPQSDRAWKSATTAYNQANTAYKQAVAYGKSKKANKLTTSAIQNARDQFNAAKTRYAKAKYEKGRSDYYAKQLKSAMDRFTIFNGAGAIENAAEYLEEKSNAVVREASAVQKYATATVKAKDAAKKSLSAKISKKKKAKITKWSTKTVKVRGGKMVKARTIKVQSDAKRVYLQYRAKNPFSGSYSKWSNVRSAKVKKGKAKVHFVGFESGTIDTYQFRVVVKETKKYQKVVTKPMVVKVK